MVATEQPSSFLASTEVLNAIISGEPVQVERKYRDAYTITPRAKIAWAMNELPRIGAADSGLFRRVKVLEFPGLDPEERDPKVKAEIMEEGAGILNWALEGLDRLRKRGEFEIPDCVVAATNEYQEVNDVPALFADEVCIRDDGAEIKSSKLYGLYRAWCEEHGHKPQSSTTIARDWKRLGYEKVVKKTRQVLRRHPGEVGG